MFRYRKLSYEEMIQLATTLLIHAQVRPLRSFLDDYYGKETYMVDVDIEYTESGAEVYAMQVFTSEYVTVLPNMMLSGWEELAVEEGDEMDLHASQDEQLAWVSACMRRYNIYRQYRIPTVSQIGVRVEGNFILPELYVQEKEHWREMFFSLSAPGFISAMKSVWQRAWRMIAKVWR